MSSQAQKGLQPERTAAAWSRTGAAVVVNALLIARIGFRQLNQVWGHVYLVIGFLALLAWLAIYLFMRREQNLQLNRHAVVSHDFVWVAVLVIGMCLVVAYHAFFE